MRSRLSSWTTAREEPAFELRDAVLFSMRFVEKLQGGLKMVEQAFSWQIGRAPRDASLGLGQERTSGGS